MSEVALGDGPGEDDKAEILAAFEAQAAGGDECPICFTGLCHYETISDRTRCASCRQEICQGCLEQHECAMRDNLLRTESREAKPGCPMCRAEIDVMGAEYLHAEYLKFRMRSDVAGGLGPALLERAGSPEEVGRWVASVADALERASLTLQEPTKNDEGAFLLQGDHVMLDGLKSKALNGKHAIVFKYIIPGEDGAERFAVRVLNEEAPTPGGDASCVKAVKIQNIQLIRRSPRNAEAKDAVDRRTAEILEAWPTVQQGLSNEAHWLAKAEGTPEVSQEPELFLRLLREAACADPARVLARREEPFFRLESLKARRIEGGGGDEPNVVLQGANPFVYPLYRENMQVSNVRSITTEREVAAGHHIASLRAAGRVEQAEDLERKLVESRRAIAQSKSRTDGRILIRSPRATMQGIDTVQGLPDGLQCYVAAYSYVGPM